MIKGSTIETMKNDKLSISKESKDIKEEIAKLRHEKLSSTREINK